ncbi:ATP-binding cassette domain-containing protein [Streptosporangium vulgare]|uniref:ATP-binding cassette domain-containing protein n=1 Tax=Streptosporangium vulgare TaxID=46190 RepID=UPI0031CFA6D6
MLLIGGLRVVEGVLSIGILISFRPLLAALSSGQPAHQPRWPPAGPQGRRASASPTWNATRRPAAFERPGTETGDPTTPLEGHLELREVTFGYGTAHRSIIENLSLSMTPGQRVAIVAAPAAWKSTLGRPLTGLYEPRSGQICSTATRWTRIPRTVLAARVAYVDQGHRAVRRNRTRQPHPGATSRPPRRGGARPLAKYAAVYDADAGPPRRDQLVPSARTGRNSAAASGSGSNCGPRRASPRADPAILDEATSALDPETERVIMDNLRRPRLRLPCMMAPHRPVHHPRRDEIIVLDRGQVRRVAAATRTARRRRHLHADCSTPEEGL